jgi:hypothetical protein
MTSAHWGTRVTAVAVYDESVAGLRTFEIR